MSLKELKTLLDFQIMDGLQVISIPAILTQIRAFNEMLKPVKISIEIIRDCFYLCGKVV